MYKRYNNNNQGRGQRNRFYGRTSGNRRTIKKLHPSLFVNKSIEEEAQVEQLSSVTFADFAISDQLKKNILDRGYTIPTPIQEKAIPALLAGNDVIGIANTGTGKTAAFLIPLINKVLADKNERALILVPTKELALQIVEELKELKRGMNIDSTLIIGGASMYRQTQELRHNPHFVIGTPGRVKDLIQQRKLNLEMFQNIVLDEVDRMVDIGFITDIKYFISMLPKKRQSLFFSATVSGEAGEILKRFVVNPVTISVKQSDNVDKIDQNIVELQNGYSKIDMLHNLLVKEGFDKVLIFGQTKWGIEKLTKNLIERGIKVAAIHGNKSLGQRTRALEMFKRSEIQILLATDVASRGLDIDNVTHVINYDAPESQEDYIHRIGRTGRAGKRGVALTFVD